MDAMESFDVLEVQKVQVQYGGEVLEVKPLTIGQLPAFVRHIRPIFAALSRLEEVQQSGGDIIDPVMEVIDEHGDALQGALAVATGKPLTFIQSGQADEFMLLVRAVMKVNQDFFGRRFGLLRGILPSVVEPASPGDGQTAYSS